MANLLSGIPVLSTIAENVPSMDYEGQKLAEKLYQWIIILFAVVGFVWGFICQQFVQTIIILGAGVTLAVLLVVPPWPWFRTHPLPWQKVQEQKTTSSKRKDKTKNS